MKEAIQFNFSVSYSSAEPFAKISNDKGQVVAYVEPGSKELALFEVAPAMLGILREEVEIRSTSSLGIGLDTSIKRKQNLVDRTKEIVKRFEGEEKVPVYEPFDYETIQEYFGQVICAPGIKVPLRICGANNEGVITTLHPTDSRAHYEITYSNLMNCTIYNTQTYMRRVIL